LAVLLFGKYFSVGISSLQRFTDLTKSLPGGSVELEIEQTAVELMVNAGLGIVVIVGVGYRKISSCFCSSHAVWLALGLPWRACVTRQER